MPSRGCFTWPRLTIQPLVARKKMELSSLRSQSLGAPNKKVALGEMDERKIPARFEKRNVFDSHDPSFDIVSQESESSR